MVANNGGRMRTLRSNWKDRRFFTEEALRLNTIVQDEGHLTLVRLTDGTFTIRAHDELTPGGVRLVLEDPETACEPLAGSGFINP